MKTKIISNEKRGRYVPIKGYQGLRKDLSTNKIIVRKSVHGKVYSASFSTLKEALLWKNNFHPSLTYTNVVSQTSDDEDLFQGNYNQIQSRPNGEKGQYYFKDIWQYYQEYYFPSLALSSVEEKERKGRLFFDGLLGFKMIEINAELLDLYLKNKIENAKSIDNPRRFNFDCESNFTEA